MTPDTALFNITQHFNDFLFEVVSRKLHNQLNSKIHPGEHNGTLFSVLRGDPKHAAGDMSSIQTPLKWQLEP